MRPMIRLLFHIGVNMQLALQEKWVQKEVSNNFRTGDTQVIFLNSNYEGSGINLKEADTIIVYSDLSPNKLSQVIGRANRIGRTIPLNVHHLLVNNNNN